MRETSTHIYFCGSVFSNWEPCKIEYNNLLFNSSEQLFMYFKAIYFNDLITAEKIINFGFNPKTAKLLGREVKNYNDIEWNKIREEMMYKACLLKFKSDKNLTKKLIDTDDKILVEASSIDLIWGVGFREDDNRILYEKNWRGQNLLGIVLMRVRDTLKM